MSIDLKELRLALARNKVFNAWQYVESLIELLDYMTISRDLCRNVFAHRRNIIGVLQQELIQNSLDNPYQAVPITKACFQRSHLNIAGYEINDVVFLRKNLTEFFHYARTSMDILVQITNAALLGENAHEISDKKIIQKVVKSLSTTNDFKEIYEIFKKIKEDDIYGYLCAFDNYLKHIKTIFVKVENSIIVDDSNTFSISPFVYKDKSYEGYDALSRMESIANMVFDYTDQVLAEIFVLLPTAKGTDSRIQTLKFEQFVKDSPESNLAESITFFIEVDHSLDELPSEISVYPLTIKEDGEIYSFDFRFEEIFVRRKNTSEGDPIVGCARLKNGVNTDEFYRKFIVEPSSSTEYGWYMVNFRKKYPHYTVNLYAMEGQIVYG